MSNVDLIAEDGKQMLAFTQIFDTTQAI